MPHSQLIVAVTANHKKTYVYKKMTQQKKEYKI